MKSIWNRIKGYFAAAGAAVGMWWLIITGQVEAQAPSDTVRWTMPTTRQNGAALPIGELAKTTVSVYSSLTGGTAVRSVDVTAPATSVVIPRTAPGYGTLCYAGTVTDTDGLTSAESAPRVCKTISAPPQAPTNMEVN